MKFAENDFQQKVESDDFIGTESNHTLKQSLNLNCTCFVQVPIGNRSRRIRGKFLPTTAKLESTQSTRCDP